jgi:hypothetical protein
MRARGSTRPADRQLRSGGATFLPAALAALIDTSLARGAAADIDAERQRLATVASADDASP